MRTRAGGKRRGNPSTYRGACKPAHSPDDMREGNLWNAVANARLATAGVRVRAARPGSNPRPLTHRPYGLTP